MTFAFAQQADIAGQVRAIARSQIGKALDDCSKQNNDFDKLVHGLRRRCKRLRGLVRLIEPRFKHSKAEDHAFRDAARLLSGSRDAAVMVETYGSVLAFDRRNGPSARIDMAEGRRLADWLQGRVGDAPDAERRAAMLGAFTEIFEAADRRAKDWSLSGQGFEQIGDGLQETYRQLRQGLALAADQPQAEALHDWRKHAKYHWHHVTLLQAAAPDILGPRRAALDELGELLGDHHNMAVLDAAIAEHEEAGSHDAVAAVRDTIGVIQQHLADDAFTLGRQLVAERPIMLRERFEHYWLLLPKKD